MPEGPVWLALLGSPDRGGVAVTDDRGAPGGHLLLAVGGHRPDPSAVRIEPALIGAGPALAVSLVLVPPGARPLFDDPAVVAAMREVLCAPGRAPLFSTLVDGPARWAGAISGVDPQVAAGRAAWWDEDPFARLGPRQRLLVPAGSLLPRPAPAGPGHQRHGGAPWPWGTFPGPSGAAPE